MKIKAAVICAAIVLAIILIVVLLLIIGISRDTDTDDTSGSSSAQGKKLRVDFIDVGKSDCILITTDGRTIMIDTGCKETYDDVSGFLASLNIEKIDVLVISHFDKDHIGGTGKLLSEYQVSGVYIPDYDNDRKNLRSFEKAANKTGVELNRVSEPLSFSFDRVDFCVMPSGVSYSSAKGNDNDVSLLVSMEYLSDSYLFAGDIEEDGIRSFLSRNEKTFDILKMPHHGKKEKNSKELLERVQPKYAVITDDKENPADSKLCRLMEKCGILYYCSKDNGTVTVVSNGTGIYQIRTEKEK